MNRTCVWLTSRFLASMSTATISKRGQLGIVFFLVFCSQSQMVKANRPVRPELSSGNEELEYHLEQAGVATDLASLVRAARTSKDLLVRAFAVELLGDRGERRAIDDLEAVYELDEESQIREEAALALAGMAVPGAIEKIEECLRKNPRGLVRQVYLAMRLLEFSDFVGYQYVVEAARSADPYLRDEAAMGLVRFAAAGWTETDADTMPVVLLAELLADPSARVRRAVIWNLTFGESSSFDTAGFVAEIAKLAKEDPDPDVRDEAESFLRFHKPAESEGTRP